MSAPDVNPARLATVGGSNERRLRVLVVDDHEVVHWGLRLMLGEQPWVERCLSARNTEEAMAMAKRYEPHVALVDLFVGQESGATICELPARAGPAAERPDDLRRRAGSRPPPRARPAPPASSPRTGPPPTSPARSAWSGSA